MGRAPRRFAAFLIGILLCSTAVGVFSLRGGLKPGSPMFLFGLALAMTTSWVTVVMLVRRQFFSTYVNRAATYGLISVFCLITAHRGLAVIAGHDSITIIQSDMVLIAGPFLALGALHPGFLAVGGLSVVGALISTLAPVTTRILINVLPVVMAFGINLLWRRISLSDQVLVDRVQTKDDSPAAQPPRAAAP